MAGETGGHVYRISHPSRSASPNLALGVVGFYRGLALGAERRIGFQARYLDLPRDAARRVSQDLNWKPLFISKPPSTSAPSRPTVPAVDCHRQWPRAQRSLLPIVNRRASGSMMSSPAPAGSGAGGASRRLGPPHHWGHGSAQPVRLTRHPQARETSLRTPQRRRSASTLPSRAQPRPSCR
jgi:hypothetical protein